MSDKILNEHLKKILHKSDYIVNESPKYHPILDGIDEDDSLPDDLNGTEEETPETEINIDEPEINIEEPPIEDVPVPEPEPMPDELAPVNIEEPIDSPQESIDKVQNEILKLNIATMKKVQSQVDILNSKVDDLANNVGHLNVDVEEVKEPTDLEKLTGRKEDSHPYYMNLNDMWTDGEFQGKNDEFSERGMRKLDDGTYIADFDTLKDEFNNHDDNF